ncbi:MAG: glycoside hydrolase family 3 protein [Rhodothermales bacterium]
MKRVQWMLGWIGGVLGVWLLMTGGGCGEAVSSGDAVPVGPGSYEAFTAPADTGQAGSRVLDSLFLAHGLPVLAHVRPDSASAARWTDSVLAALSLEEKIGQLFIVHLPDPDRRRGRNEALEAVQTYGVGGFLVSRLLPPRTVFDETRRLQQAARVPLFFAADYERGAGRFDNALTELPSNMALGATRDTLLTAAAGRLTALESRALGVNLLFAPVVDVNNNPDNPIINVRSYGEDPRLVGRMAAAFVSEVERYGVLTTLKHFPGHGNTSVDSHARMGVVEGTVGALDSIEFRPYRRVLGGLQAPAAVMSAHLWVPALDDQPMPATFSRRLLRDVLRDSLGFDGFVVTDDIKMGALRNTYSTDERIVRPLQAGADVILTPVSLPRAVEAVKTALRRGDLDEAALDRSVRRVLWAKARAGLPESRLADEDMLDHLLEKPRGAFLAQAIANRAVTLLKTGLGWPLLPGRRVALVQLSTIRNAESLDAAMDSLAALLGPEADLRLGPRSSQAATNRALRLAGEAEVVVLALYLRLQAGRGEAGLFPRQDRFVRRLLDREASVVLVTLGNPYAVLSYPGAGAILVAYDQSLASVAAVGGILQGRQAAQGTLPVTIEPYPFGSGLRQGDPGRPGY